MSDGPREVIRTDKWRLVQLPNAAYVCERFSGLDAMGAERWTTIELGSKGPTESFTVWLRDFLIEHAKTCALLREGVDDANHGDGRRE